VSVQEKVVAYITRGMDLLVFRHTEFPEAGIQVPAGSVEPGESLRSAVLREAYEESGLASLQACTYLGSLDPVVGSSCEPAAYRLHFFHLPYHGKTPPRWRHHEALPSDGSDGPIEFEFHWVRLPDGVPELTGGQGAFLAYLIETLKSVEGSSTGRILGCRDE
jgi:8-oxo-dGTP pyrophosphatase MutT (NUDIX family)